MFRRRNMADYIWQNPLWPQFSYNKDKLIFSLSALDDIRNRLGGAAAQLDHEARMNFTMRMIANETVKNSEIEGESLDMASVWSSVSRRLGQPASPRKAKAHEENNVEIIFDALHNKDAMTTERILSWHRILFSSLPRRARPDQIGAWRTGPVYIMGGRTIGKETTVYEGVPASRIPSEMDRLISWIAGQETDMDGIIRSALTHLWFVCIHPFGDGNGRLARTLSEYILALDRDDGGHYYSVSAQIIRERSAYYEALSTVSSQSGSMDVTSWLVWYIAMLSRAMSSSLDSISMTMKISRMVRKLDPSIYNSRQITMLVTMVEGSFFGKLTSGKWAKMMKCSQDTALRDIVFMLEKGLLVRLPAGGRSTAYELSLDIEEVLARL